MNVRRKQIRCDKIDYNDGDFFVTICTGGKRHYFGEIYGGDMHFTELGRFVNDQLKNVNTFVSDLEVILFVVMPNHIHLIVRINKKGGDFDVDKRQLSPNPTFRINHDDSRQITRLSRYINSFKGATTKYAKSHNIPFCWQPKFHDHKIRNCHDGEMIWEYILNNVAKWEVGENE